LAVVAQREAEMAITEEEIAEAVAIAKGHAKIKGPEL
jgi:hypothetical protein